MGKNFNQYKIILLGEGAIGKTAIRQRFVGNGFNAEYIKTVGADFSTKIINVKNIEIKYQIWDPAGHFEFQSRSGLFYPGCSGAILVFDLTDLDTLYKLDSWINEAIVKSKASIKTWFLVGNKCDLERKVEYKQVLNFAQSSLNKISPDLHYLETSAKTGENIDKLFNDLGQILLQNDGLM